MERSKQSGCLPEGVPAFLLNRRGGMKNGNRILIAIVTTIIVFLVILPSSAYTYLIIRHDNGKSYNSVHPGKSSGIVISNASIVSTEKWVLILDNGQGRSDLELYKTQDGTITSNGSWVYTYQGANVTGPYSDAAVTIAGSSMSIMASGTATNPAAPQGYQTSPFTLSFIGTALDGQGNGTYTMTFQTFGWPSTITGNWEGSRTGGSGITAPVEKAMSLHWIMLLLKNKL